MDLSVILVNWNAAEYAVAAINSLAATADSLDYEVLLVDNGSTDDARDILGQPLPRTTLIRNTANLGFARAANLGARQARGGALLFLNPDTQVLDGAPRSLVEALCSAASIGAVGPRLLKPDGTPDLNAVHPFPTILNQVLGCAALQRLGYYCRLGAGRALRASAWGGPVDVPAVPGTCLATRTELFRQLGGFSEDYFLYAEDLDFCFRVRRAGLRVCLVPSARVIHHGARSSRKQPEGFAETQQRESVYRFFLTTRGPAYASRYRSALRAAARARLLLLQAALILLGSRERLLEAQAKWLRVHRWARDGESRVSRTAPRCPTSS